MDPISFRNLSELGWSPRCAFIKGDGSEGSYRTQGEFVTCIVDDRGVKLKGKDNLPILGKADTREESMNAALAKANEALGIREQKTELEILKEEVAALKRESKKPSAAIATEDDEPDEEGDDDEDFADDLDEDDIDEE